VIAREAVEIVWEDSQLAECGWQQWEDHQRFQKDATNCRMVTVGLLTKETKRYLTIVQSAGCGQVNAAIKIPKRCVVSRRTLARYR
jgi:hypothetical protein